MEQQNGQSIKQISLKILLAIFSFLVALYVFGALAHEIFLEKEDELDRAVLGFMKANTSSDLAEFMHALTFFGKHVFLIPAYLFLIGVFIILHKKNYAIETAIIGASSTILLFALKFLFQRERPDFPLFERLPGYSFPSGHALSSFVFCSLLIYLVWNGGLKKKWKWILSSLLLLFSLAIGISRIVLRVHYASDVLAGFCMGYAWVIFCLWAQRNYLNNRKKKQARQQEQQHQASFQ